jgi:hypothetical protein
MEDDLESEKSRSILDWLDSIGTSANSQLKLEDFGGSASPPQAPNAFPSDSSPVLPTVHCRLCTNPRMTYGSPDDELTFSQAVEACTNGIETPPYSRTSQSPGTPAAASSSRPLPPRREKLRFLRLDEWDEHNTYDEEVPSYLHYSIEWKVSLNKKAISNDTEQDLVLAPTAYWHEALKPNLDDLIQRKVAQNRTVRCDDTTIVASVNDRSERDLTKRFNDTNIDWSVIEKQLIKWGELFRSGKKLRLNISFKYVDSQRPTDTATKLGSKPGSKRGLSATKRMLADRATQLDAEEESSGHPSIWREIYALFRCPGPPCDLGPYCWRDPTSKKRYKLRTCHLKALIDWVEQDNSVQSQNDVPEHIREQLLTEEHQRLERQPNAPTNAPTPYPPINITNVLPSSNQPSIAGSMESSMLPESICSNICPLNIPGYSDVAVQQYSEWQQSKVAREDLKDDIVKACEAALDDGLDLEQIYADQDPEFFILKGVKRGVARRFIHDIPEWAKRQKRSHSVELE